MKETIKKIFEGCGKEVPHKNDNWFYICGKSRLNYINNNNGKEKDKKEKIVLCQDCKAKAKGYIQRTKEVEEIINNKLKDFIADNIQQDILEDLKEALQNEEIIKLGEENGLD